MPPPTVAKPEPVPEVAVAADKAPAAAESGATPAPPSPSVAGEAPAAQPQAAPPESPQPAPVRAAAVAPPAPSPSGGQPVLERREAIGANRQVARVDTAFVPVQQGAAGKTGQAPGAGDGPAPNLYEYTVKVPFLLGKTALGKEGEKALRELAQIGPIAHEVHILAPREPDSSIQLAHRRASELYRLLVNAGLDRQKFTIEVMDAVPFEADIVGEVVLVVDLNQRPAK